MKLRLITTATAILAAVLGASSAYAHHAFAAEFDRNKPIELEGTVTRVEWTNPHARFYIDAPDPDLDGEVVNWNFELSSPNGLMRAGWRPDSLQPGDRVSVTGWRARNAPHVANARAVIDANGRELFADSSAEAEAQRSD